MSGSLWLLGEWDAAFSAPSTTDGNTTAILLKSTGSLKSIVAVTSDMLGSALIRTNARCIAHV